MIKHPGNDEVLFSVKYLNPFVEIEIDRLVPHPLNKEIFPMVDIDSIAESIRQHGVIEPIVIRPKADFEEMQKFLDSDAETCLKHFQQFFICAGHRRVEALKRLGYKTVPARIIIPRFKGADELILIHENLNQRILSPGTVLKATSIERRITPIEVLLSELPEKIREYHKKGLISDKFVRILASQDNSPYEEVIDTLEKIEKLGFKGKVKSSQELEKLRQKLREKEDEIKKLIQEKEKVDREKERLERERNILENSIRRLNEAVNLREEKIRKLNENLATIKAELGKLHQEVEVKPSPEIERKIKESHEKMRQIKSLLTLKEEELRKFKEKLREEKEKYEALKQEMKRIVEEEVYKRTEEARKELQEIIKITKKQLEKEREEKKRLLEEMERLAAQKNSAYAPKKPSNDLSPEERTVLGVIAHIKGFMLFMTEHEDVIKNVKERNPNLYKEAIITIHDLAKALQGLTLEIGEEVLRKEI